MNKGHLYTKSCIFKKYLCSICVQESFEDTSNYIVISQNTMPSTISESTMFFNCIFEQFKSLIFFKIIDGNLSLTNCNFLDMNVKKMFTIVNLPSIQIRNCQFYNITSSFILNGALIDFEVNSSNMTHIIASSFLNIQCSEYQMSSIYINHILDSANIIQIGGTNSISISFFILTNSTECYESEFYISSINRAYLYQCGLSMKKNGDEHVGVHINAINLSVQNCCFSRPENMWFSDPGGSNSIDIIGSGVCESCVPFVRKQFVIERDIIREFNLPLERPYLN